MAVGSSVLRTPVPVKDTDTQTELRLIRWGVPRDPVWLYGAVVIAPSAGDTLVALTVGTKATARLYGFHIQAQEGNTFHVAKSVVGVRFSYSLAAAGSIDVVLPVPLLELAAGETVRISIEDNAAAGMMYQANLLYDEA